MPVESHAVPVDFIDLVSDEEEKKNLNTLVKLEFNPNEVFIFLNYQDPNSFRLVKFIEENLIVGVTQKHYTSNPKIKVDSEEVIVWDNSYLKSMSIRKSLIACCLSSDPPVLVITCNDTRIICFLDESPHRVFNLSVKLSRATGYHEMRYIPALSTYVKVRYCFSLAGSFTA